MLLALALAGVILAFATADPEVSVFSPAGPWLLLGSAVAAVGFGRATGAAATRWSRRALRADRRPGALWR